MVKNEKTDKMEADKSCLCTVSEKPEVHNDTQYFQGNSEIKAAVNDKKPIYWGYGISAVMFICAIGVVVYLENKAGSIDNYRKINEEG